MLYCITYAKSDIRDTRMKRGEEEHEERDDRDGDGEEAQLSAIILRNDLVTYFAITK